MPTRHMIVANQNETVRKVLAQEDVFLATIGLQGCVAVIMQGLDGKISLTHVDTDTDLRFIEGEIHFLGEVSALWIVKKPKCGELDLKVQWYLEKGSLPKATLLSSPEGTVVFNHLKSVPQVFRMSDFIELQTSEVAPSAANKLHALGYQPRLCHENLLLNQLRTYTRQLNCAASQVANHSPLLVHDESGWLATILELEADVEGNIQRQEISFFRQASLSYVWPRYQHLLKVIEKTNALESNPALKPV
jgi:hypothetical protein